MTIHDQGNDRDDIIFEYLEEMDQTFTLTDLFKATGIKKTKKNEAEISELIQATDHIVSDKKAFYPKSTFLKDVPFRIRPTEFEIKKGILIPGHRMLPFHPPGMFMGEMVFKYNGPPVKTKRMTLKMEEIQFYFCLMDLQKFPIINIEDILQDDAELEIDVCDLKPFYKQNKFKPGDMIIVKPTDFQAGFFHLVYDPFDNYQRHIFEIQKRDRLFMDALKKVMEKELVFPNIEKQLLYTYFYLLREGGPWTVPGTALGPLLAEQSDIRFSALPNGRTVFHFAHQTVDDLDIYPDLPDYLEEIEAEEEEFEFNTIDGILKFLDNNNDCLVVRALLLDQITEQNGFSYQKIEGYLFDGLEKPYMPPELREIFQLLVKLEYEELEEEFDPATAFLPVTTTRKKVLEACLLISTFLRSLDAREVPLEALPKTEMMHLMELDRSLAEVLFTLEASQLEGENNNVEARRIQKMIERMIPELPGIFDVICAKIK
jgi:hypothetical protein